MDWPHDVRSHPGDTVAYGGCGQPGRLCTSPAVNTRAVLHGQALLSPQVRDVDSLDLLLEVNG